MNTIFTSIQPVQTNSIVASGRNNNDDEINSFNQKHHNCPHPDCGKSFRYKSDFTRHKLTHTSQRLINCPVEGCTKTFKRNDVLKTHMRTHTHETPYKCEEPGCGQSFAYRAGLRYHSLKHTGGKGYVCSFPGCNKAFLVMSQLKQHENRLNYHHRLSNQTLSQDENEDSMNPIKAIKFEDAACYAGSTAREVNLLDKLKIESGILKDENSNKSLDEEFERMVKTLVYENSVIKKKLKMLLGESVQKKKHLETKSLTELTPSPTQQPSNEMTSACLNFEVKSE